MATKFKVLENAYHQGLAREVEIHLNQGWRLAGPFVVDAGKFYQPVCRDVDDAKPVDDSGSYDRAMKGL